MIGGSVNAVDTAECNTTITGLNARDRTFILIFHSYFDIPFGFCVIVTSCPTFLLLWCHSVRREDDVIVDMFVHVVSLQR